MLRPLRSAARWVALKPEMDPASIPVLMLLVNLLWEQHFLVLLLQCPYLLHFESCVHQIFHKKCQILQVN
jgi:hypothetical protein